MFLRRKNIGLEHFLKDRSLSVLTGCELEVSEKNKKSKEEINNDSQASRKFQDQITSPPPPTQLF